MNALVEVSFRLEDSDAVMVYAQDDEIDSKIVAILGELKLEEKRYVDVLDCISKVRVKPDAMLWYAPAIRFYSFRITTGV